MKVDLRIILAILTLSMVASSLHAQVAAGAPTDAQSLLTQITGKFAGQQQFRSVQLTGTVERHAGSTSDTGTITLTTGTDGSNQAKIQLSEGQRKETQTALTNQRSCAWSGPDGVEHDSSSSTCWPALVWFLPQITLNPVQLPTILGTDYRGLSTTPKGTSAYLLVNQLVINAGKTPPSFTSWIMEQSKTSLYVDLATLVPIVLAYKVLADSGSATIPVEVRYSNYRTLSGLTVPGHIERYLNGSLELAIDINEVSISN
jgi:hypothetical protein